MSSAAHDPAYEPGARVGDAFTCRVRCSCGDLDKVARSGVSAAAARVNAGRQFARHLKSAAPAGSPAPQMPDEPVVPIEPVEAPDPDDGAPHQGRFSHPPGDASTTYRCEVRCTCGTFRTTVTNRQSPELARLEAEALLRRHADAADVDQPPQPPEPPEQPEQPEQPAAPDPPPQLAPLAPEPAPTAAPSATGTPETTRSHRRRRVRVALAVLAAVVVVVAGATWGLSSRTGVRSSPAPTAVQRACAGWTWDAGQSLATNDQRLTTTAGHVLDLALDAEMRRQCPTTIAPYDAALAAETAQARAATTAVTDGRTLDGVRASLALHGASHREVAALGRVAHRTGYRPSRGPLPYFDAEDFAALSVSNCEAVTSHYLTWSDQVAEAVADGTPRRLAVEMNRYLAGTFCHQVH